LIVYPDLGRLSTIVSKALPRRLELVQGTLDMLILRTLVPGAAHGHEIARHIQRTSDDALQVEHGSLYPALHRLERKGWVSAKWETPKGGKRDFKYYRLTPAGKRQLAAEHSRWRRLVTSIGQVMEPAQG
jgi:transcriptional regulator